MGGTRRSADAFPTPMPKPSEQIRLLRLPNQPEDGDLLRLVLTTFDLDDLPPFYALSYTWGCPLSKDESDRTTWARPEVQFEIVCNEQTVTVTQNLSEGLWRIAAKYPGILLWNDALCIDQLDESEKLQQIMLMGDIYTRASKAIIWLGVAGKHDMDYFYNMCMLYQRRASEQSSNTEVGLQIWRTILPSAPHTGSFDEEGRLLGATNALVKIMMRPYWYRAWTFQEAVLAKSVEILCGQFTFQIETVCQIGYYLGLPKRCLRGSVLDSALGIYGGMQTINELRRTAFCSAADPQHIRETLDSAYNCHNFAAILLYLLEQAGGRRATEPQDQVLSLAGPAKVIAHRIGQRTDMTFTKKQVSGNDYFAEASKYIHLNLPYLASLRYCRPTGGGTSWVIDANVMQVKASSRLSFEQLPVIPTDSCSCGKPALNKRDSGRRFVPYDLPMEHGKTVAREAFCLRGIRIGAISPPWFVVPISKASDSDDDRRIRDWESLKQMLSFCETIPKSYWRRNSRHDSLWQVLGANSLFNGGAEFQLWAAETLASHMSHVVAKDPDEEGKGWGTFGPLHRDGLRRILGFDLLLDARNVLAKKQAGDSHDEVPAHQRRSTSLLGGNHSGYCLFQVGDRLGVSHALNADERRPEIWVFEGGRTPFVMFPTATDLRLSCSGIDVYVDGAMHGELVDDGGEKAAWQEVWIV